MRESDHEIMSPGIPLDISSNFVARLIGLKSCWRNSDDTMLMFWWEDDGWVRIVWGRQWVRGLHLPCWICPDLSWQAVPPASLHALTTFPSYSHLAGNTLLTSFAVHNQHLANTLLALTDNRSWQKFQQLSFGTVCGMCARQNWKVRFCIWNTCTGEAAGWDDARCKRRTFIFNPTSSYLNILVTSYPHILISSYPHILISFPFSILSSKQGNPFFKKKKTKSHRHGTIAALLHIETLQILPRDKSGINI